MSNNEYDPYYCYMCGCPMSECIKNKCGCPNDGGY
ncbi:hypothetical protein LCGC14_0363480 [marine sediment metagenome]|uniref:Uncharacterized protein n=1 Tax=marine sediment metagenome TaxID=412755 RepID=A0A0F9VUJ7_9ZZZZ